MVGGRRIPNDYIARAGRPKCANGVVVDLEARTSDPAIYAIGDVTHRPLPLYGRDLRLESVPNALEQAQAGRQRPCRPPAPRRPRRRGSVRQYDLKLQIAGLPFDADDILVRGDPESAKFAVFHLKGDLVQAVEAVNAPPEFMMGKQLILKRTPISRERLADPSISMKEVAA